MYDVHVQAIMVLNHAGLCVSYATVWKYLKQLTAEARFLEIVREGHWLWVFDNLNVQRHVHHERQGKQYNTCGDKKIANFLHKSDRHSSMMNVTSRLALRIRYLPDFEFDWSDTTPQRPRDSLTADDFLPSEEDARILKQHAVHFMMGFLVESFTSLSDLTKFVPALEHLHPITKSEVVPMKVLFYDEKYKSETISRLACDANLSGTPQV